MSKTVKTITTIDVKLRRIEDGDWISYQIVFGEYANEKTIELGCWSPDKMYDVFKTYDERANKVNNDNTGPNSVGDVGKEDE